MLLYFLHDVVFLIMKLPSWTLVFKLVKSHSMERKEWVSTSVPPDSVLQFLIHVNNICETVKSLVDFVNTADFQHLNSRCTAGASRSGRSLSLGINSHRLSPHTVDCVLGNDSD